MSNLLSRSQQPTEHSAASRRLLLQKNASLTYVIPFMQVALAHSSPTSCYGQSLCDGLMVAELTDLKSTDSQTDGFFETKGILLFLLKCSHYPPGQCDSAQNTSNPQRRELVKVCISLTFVFELLIPFRACTLSSLEALTVHFNKPMLFLSIAQIEPGNGTMG